MTARPGGRRWSASQTSYRLRGERQHVVTLPHDDVLGVHFAALRTYRVGTGALPAQPGFPPALRHVLRVPLIPVESRS